MLHEFAFTQTNFTHNGSHHSTDRLGVLSVCIQCLLYKWTDRKKGFEHFDEDERLIEIHVSSNGLGGTL